MHLSILQCFQELRDEPMKLCRTCKKKLKINVVLYLGAILCYHKILWPNREKYCTNRFEFAFLGNGLLLEPLNIATLPSVEVGFS